MSLERFLMRSYLIASKLLLWRHKLLCFMPTVREASASGALSPKRQRLNHSLSIDKGEKLLIPTSTAEEDIRVSTDSDEKIIDKEFPQLQRIKLIVQIQILGEVENDRREIQVGRNRGARVKTLTVKGMKINLAQVEEERAVFEKEVNCLSLEIADLMREKA
ncbi:hypothetical protein HAX54_037468 [Datura stramonium]|uniref:Uncharacterized protein n=1 Tax=Datura stramonium TaxID=4076 RepID=A0ABS8VJY1_DATST|nr:hypothetical protein [Datura stramonium]